MSDSSGLASHADLNQAHKAALSCLGWLVSLRNRSLRTTGSTTLHPSCWCENCNGGRITIGEDGRALPHPGPRRELTYAETDVLTDIEDYNRDVRDQEPIIRRVATWVCPGQPVRRLGKSAASCHVLAFELANELRCKIDQSCLEARRELDPDFGHHYDPNKHETIDCDWMEWPLARVWCERSLSHIQRDLSQLKELDTRELSVLIDVEHANAVQRLAQIRAAGTGGSVTPLPLPAAERSEGTAGKPKQIKNRGRKSDTDKKVDKQIWDAWRTREHKTYEQLAAKLGRTKTQVANAIGRHRKRLAKRRKPAPE